MSASALTRSPTRFDAIDKLLVTMSVACGTAYLITRGLAPYPGDAIVKTLSVLSLAFVAFHSLRTRDGFLLGVSLLFSSLGDLFLAIDGEKLFLFGLGSFLIAHLLYIALFARNWPTPLSATTGQRLLVACLTIYSAAMLWWLWRDLGSLKLPVAVYLSAITTMGAAAALAGFETRWIIIGALLFVFSDSLIAIGKFKSPVGYGNYLVWGSYYLAQVLIAAGFLREKARIDGSAT
jgi:uncharacterized membrane protein YhhN